MPEPTTDTTDGVVMDYAVDLQPRATCENCVYQTSPSSASRERALHHARTRNHRVRISTETAEFWQPAGWKDSDE